MRFGSLFSGVGGFDLGFERAGMECAWQVEIDATCQSVLAHHWPNVKRFGDVRNFGRNNLDSVDLICGGFPCQDVSLAGKRAGLAGERSGLWYEFHRILAELKPQWVVIENVPGLLSSNAGRDFATILRGLVELGYGVCWRVLDAQYFGVPQMRNRVYVIASLGDGRAAQVLFEANVEFFQADGRRMVSPTLTAKGPVDNGGGSWLHGFVIINSDGTMRNIMPTEAERLQGFPDEWTDGQSDRVRYRQLGNAVCVPVAEWIGRRLEETSHHA